MNKLVILFFLLFVSIFIISSFVNAEDNFSNKFDFIEVTVETGDTLWNIAKPYYDGESDYRKFIYEIRKINNLKEGIIYPGQVILIPKTS